MVSLGMDENIWSILIGNDPKACSSREFLNKYSDCWLELFMPSVGLRLGVSVVEPVWMKGFWSLDDVVNWSVNKEKIH